MSTFQVQSIIDFLAPWWVELCFLVSFPFGYFLVQSDFFGHVPTQKKGKTKNGKQPYLAPPARHASADVRIDKLQKTLEREVSAGDMTAAVKLWRKHQATVPSSTEVLKLAVQALTACSPSTVLKEVSQHIELHGAKLKTPQAALAILDAVGHGKHSALLDDLSNMCHGKMGIPLTCQWYETLLAGHAFAGNDSRVKEVCKEMKEAGIKLSARAHSLIIKGYLRTAKLEPAMDHAKHMCREGFYVPPFAVVLLVRVAVEQQCLEDVVSLCTSLKLQLPDEAVTIIFEDCLRHSSFDLALKVETSARGTRRGVLPNAAYDPLLKVYVIAGEAEARAAPLWREMISKADLKISEGLCVGILARSAESRSIKFAEEVYAYCLATDKISIALYSALMKVYAYCGHFDLACDLYPEILSRGLEPDAVMYGCLMRFATECGHVELSKKLFEIAPQLDVQNYMSLIRAAGRDRDANRAFELLGKLLQTTSQPDIVVFNCVLDACVCSGDLPRAKAFVEEIRSRFGALDVITYNTLVKGVAAAGDVDGCYELLRQMKKEGVKSTDIFYNCIINAAACAGNFSQAWEAVEAMQADGIKADHYTLSILLKALKRYGNARESKRVLNLLDKSGIDICTEEVLLNTLLEVCMHIGENSRLRDLLHQQERSSAKPSLHLYGALIKANNCLRRINKCWSLWHEMVEERHLEPNEVVLGCMLDALVCNKELDDALALFRTWRDRVGANSVMYSTLIKGFSAASRTDEAMEMWQDIKDAGIPMNAVVYNALIDAQARSGNTEKIAQLRRAMQRDGVEPDAITYSTMVKSHCVKGDMSRALETLKEMQDMGLVRDCVVFNTVLDWCTKHNRMDIADGVLEDFERLNIQPSNFTVGILVKMYGRRRQLERAFQVAQQLPAKWGFKPNAQVCTCLMSACFLNNSPGKAIEVFNDLLKVGGADSKSLGVALNGLIRTGRVREAAALVEDALGLSTGSRRSSFTYETLPTECLEPLFTSLAQRGLAEEVAMPLISKLRKAGISINSRLLSSALDPSKNNGPRSQQGNRASFLSQ